MTLTVIKKQLRKYLSLFIQINADLEKSNFPKSGPCICWLIQVTLSLTVSLKAAEKLNCSLLVHPWDMHADGWANGQILAPLAYRFVSDQGSRKR